MRIDSSVLETPVAGDCLRHPNQLEHISPPDIQEYTHKHTNKQTIAIIESPPRVPPGKSSWLDMDSATAARTHVQRVQGRCHNQRDFYIAATDAKEATSTDAPRTNFYDITGPPRIYNGD